MAGSDRRQSGRVAEGDPERTEAEADRASERAALVREIEAEARATVSWTGRAAFSARVLDALGKVPRHEFVPPSRAGQAYANAALAIGHGQTISQPYVVALMTDLAEIREDHVVLEVGTGCGYQAAILAALAQAVYSVEVIEELAREAEQRLRRLGFDNVHVRRGDGYEGWREHAPFDAILVTAGARAVPPPLVEQLENGGRLVIPIGPHPGAQQLVLLEKDDRGRVETRSVLPVAFVPLTRPETG